VQHDTPCHAPSRAITQRAERRETKRMRDEKEQCTDVLHHDLLGLVHLLLDKRDLVHAGVVREVFLQE
jgi:hypothetical protein